ncbi:pseudouridine synthase [Hydromonas duriensis]|uniref:pseudouridine synthase n=1 Tax=Hydromonas duriensis TaxID=1527608 RepID=UPI001FE283EF|nr:pseudouridine synthase [Hydromonas duriensis]
MAFLSTRFPHISAEIWHERMKKGDVVNEHGLTIQPDAPYRAGMCLYYYRELPFESHIPVQAHVLDETEHLLIVDKPHFLPVTPGGHYLQETLLTRLRRQLNNPELSPLHRLDRETAGIMLFAKTKAARSMYQRLFAERAVHKTYLAIAPTRLDLTYPMLYQSRLEEAAQFFVMHEIEGLPNTETRITLLNTLGEHSLYQLEPLTGKKHQLRVHMSSLGMPILNDRFYPIAQAVQLDDYDKPLKLLAKKIEFIDPVTQQQLAYESTLDLIEQNGSAI